MVKGKSCLYDNHTVHMALRLQIHAGVHRGPEPDRWTTLQSVKKTVQGWLLAKLLWPKMPDITAAFPKNTGKHIAVFQVFFCFFFAMKICEKCKTVVIVLSQLSYLISGRVRLFEDALIAVIATSQLPGEAGDLICEGGNNFTFFSFISYHLRWCCVVTPALLRRSGNVWKVFRSRQVVQIINE